MSEYGYRDESEFRGDVYSAITAQREKSDEEKLWLARKMGEFIRLQYDRFIGGIE